MSFPKSAAYIDTTLGYFCPRIVNGLELPGNTTGINAEVSTSTLEMYPNPANGSVNINAEKNISKIEIYNTSGKLVALKRGINSNSFQFSYLSLSTGMYIVNIHLNEGAITTKKLIVE